MSNMREYKGKSILNFVDKYVLIDIETTGLDPKYDDIIEICALKISNNEIIEKYETLIQPVYEIPLFIEELTGITNEMVKNSPTIGKVVKGFCDFIGDDILIGHNVNFDINFLYDAAQNNGIHLSNNYIDTLRLSRVLLPELNHHRLFDLINHFSIKCEHEHRAEADCLATLDVINELKHICLEKYVTLEGFSDYCKVRYGGCRAKNISTDKVDFDESNMFYKKNVVFTGTLTQYTRKEAMQAIIDLGGICTDGINKSTNYLILANNDYSPLIKDGKSNKLKKAEDMIKNNYDIQILSENVFISIFNDK